ncbi:MAG: hypothetical protein WAR79_15175 [Melioribacteraceae bacterium]
MNTKVIEEKRHFVHNKIIIGLNYIFEGLDFPTSHLDASTGL